MSAFGNSPAESIRTGASITDYFQPPTISMQPQSVGEKPFKQLLTESMRDTQGEVTVSKRVENTLRQQGQALDQTTMKKIEEGIEKAQKEAVSQSVVVVDRMSYLVDVDRKQIVNLWHNGPNAEAPQQDALLRFQSSAVVFST